MSGVALLGVKHLEVFVPERHDLALMKTARGDERDITALAAMHRGGHPFELAVLVERYHEMMVVGPQERFRGNVLTLVDELYGERVAAALEPKLKQLEGEPRRLDSGQERALARALTEEALREAGRRGPGRSAAPAKE